MLTMSRGSVTKMRKFLTGDTDSPRRKLQDNDISRLFLPLGCFLVNR